MSLIAILLPDLGGGGAERLHVELAREFRACGHEVTFLLMSAKGELLEEAGREFPVIDLAAPRARDLAPALVRHLRHTQPDVLLAAMWPLTVIAPLAARVAGFRGSVVVSEHNMLSVQYAGHSSLHRTIMRMSMRLCYPLAAVRIGVSQGVCDDMAMLSGKSCGDMIVIHNPVRAASVADPQSRARAGAFWTGRGRRIVTVGSLKDQKNHAMLLQAMALLPKGAAQLMLLGQGENEAALRQLASSLGISRDVIFAGFHRDPTPFYETADLFVLSSDYEGFGNVIVEALASGVPVVSTDCPSGPAEILENGRYGRLTPVGDAPALAKAMQAALSETPDRDALRRRAADFSPAIIGRKYLEVMGLA